MAESRYLDSVLGQQNPPPASTGSKYLDQVLGAKTKEPAPTTDDLDESEMVGDMPAMQNILGAITGETKREFDYPELPQNIKIDGKNEPVQANTGFARGNPIGMAEIFNQSLPDVPVQFDSYGNPYVELYGATPLGKYEKRNFYLNRPGASAGDVSELFTDVGMLVAGGKIGGGSGSAVTGPAGRIIGTGLGTAAASVATDKISQILGSEQPVDEKRAAVIGLLASGGEILIPVVGRFLGAIFGSKKMFANGKLTPAGAEALKRANIDPEVVTPDFARIFQAEAVSATKPVEAAATAEARSLPVPVQLSKGDVSRDIRQQSFEEAARVGARGDPAARVMAPFRETQQEELRANLPAIQERLGGAGITEVGQGAAVAQQAVQGAAKQAREGIRKAYEAARETKAFMPADAVMAHGKNARNLLVEDGFDVAALPAVTRRLADLRRAEGLPGNARVKMQALENWRKRVVRDITAAERSNPTEAAALRSLRDNYDAWMEGAIDQALLIGDQTAVAAWRAARNTRINYRKMFETDRVVKKLISEDVTAEQAANYIFGAGRLGGQVEAANTLKAIRKIVGAESETWKALKEEAFLRLLKNQPQTIGRDMQPLFSGQMFARALNDMRRNSPTLFKTLFTQEDVSLLLRFRDTALRATTKTPGAGNPSGTAYELARLAEVIIGRSGRLTNMIVGRFGRKFMEESAAIEARQAITQPLASPKLFPPGLSGGAAAAAMSGKTERLEDQLFGQ